VNGSPATIATSGIALADFLSPAWWGWNAASGFYFYAATLLVALAMFGGLRLLFPGARDGGWSLSRLLSLLLPAWGAWFAGCGGLGVAIGLAVVAPLIILAISSPWLRAPRETASEVRSVWRSIALREALLFALFALAIGVRSTNPEIAWNIDDYGAEKFTDMAIFASCRQTNQFPPEDAWLAGNKLNYYYFGHAWWALWCRALDVPANVGYNLSLCFGFALAASLLFSLIAQATGRIPMALAGALALAWGGNPRSLEQVFFDTPEAAAWALGGHYDFWEPSRAIANTITEFPAFSFLLGDLHAHTHGWILTVGFLLWGACLLAPAKARLDGPSTPGVVGALPGAFLLGTMGATNSWDLLACCFAGAIVAWIAYGADGHWRQGTAAVAGLAVMAVAGNHACLFLPFWSSFQSPAASREAGWPFGFVPDELRSGPNEFLSHWGFPLAILALASLPWLAAWCLRLAKWATANRAGAWRFAAALVWLVAGALWLGTWAARQPTEPGRRLFVGWTPALLAVAMILAPRVFAWRSGRGRFALGLIQGSLGLLLSIELFYLDDVFGGLNERLNTVFKISYAVWPMLGVGALAALALTLDDLEGRSWGRRPAGRWGLAALQGAVLGAWLAASSVYPILATSQRARTGAKRMPESGRTLDGWAFAAAWGPERAADYALIRELAELVPPGVRPRTLEAVYGDRVPGTYDYGSRFATNLGWVAYLGWTQHVSTWRGGNWAEVAKRELAVGALYRDASTAELRALVDAYRFDAVFFGALERRLYGEERRALFAEALRGWREVDAGHGLATVWLRPDGQSDGAETLVGATTASTPPAPLK
jgi:YYY domain-containing protein